MLTGESIPAHIFRYRPLASKDQIERELASISEAYLWFSKFSDLNDPGEMTDAETEELPSAVKLGLNLLLRDGDKIAEVSYNRAKFRASKLIPKQTSSICCFSETDDHQSMWAYYASDFRGVCVRYDTQKLLSLQGFCWGNRLHPVLYSDKKLLKTEDIFDRGSRSETTTASFTIKHRDWSHEKEWRLLQRENFGKFFHTRNAISEIIIGPRTAEDLKQKIEALAREKSLTVSYARFNGFNLEFDRGVSQHTEQNAELCIVRSEVEDMRRELIKRGYDAETLGAAIGKARSYPGAEELGYIQIHDDEPILYAILGFKLSNGTQGVKILNFSILDKKFSEKFEYA